MTFIGHLFDGSTGWEQRVGASHLLDRLPSDRFVSFLGAIDPAALSVLRPLDRPVEILPGFGGVASLCTASVSRFVRRRGIQLVHAWGMRSAAAARALPKMPLIVHLFDPRIAARNVRLLRTLARPAGFAAVCSSAIVLRRLIEGGFPPELAVLIRPGVDFARINRCRRESVREDLGLALDEFVSIVPEPVTRDGGQLDAVHAVMLRNHLAGGLRVILPGNSREHRRIVEFSAALPVPDATVTPGPAYPFENLVAVADALIITPRGDASTTSIAWAMASGAAVIGTAVPAVAEFIAHKVNGLLVAPRTAAGTTAAVSRFLQDRETLSLVREAARGQAYEVFGLRRYVEQCMTLYENVLGGRAPGEGITDPAIDA